MVSLLLTARSTLPTDVAFPDNHDALLDATAFSRPPKLLFWHFLPDNFLLKQLEHHCDILHAWGNLMFERWANIDVLLFTDEPILFLCFRYIFASVSVCSVRSRTGFLINLFSIKTQTAWKTESALWTPSNFFIEPTLPGCFSEMTKITKSWRGKKLVVLNLLHDSIFSKLFARRSCH